MGYSICQRVNNTQNFVCQDLQNFTKNMTFYDARKYNVERGKLLYASPMASLGARHVEDPLSGETEFRLNIHTIYRRARERA